MGRIWSAGRTLPTPGLAHTLIFQVCIFLHKLQIKSIVFLPRVERGQYKWTSRCFFQYQDVKRQVSNPGSASSLIGSQKMLHVLILFERLSLGSTK